MVMGLVFLVVIVIIMNWMVNVFFMLLICKLGVLLNIIWYL